MSGFLAALIAGENIWSFCSHTVLPLGEVGVRMLPNEPR
jgi:hypothetical protein